MNPEQQRLQLALFGLRASVFAVMLAWALDKLLRPVHAGMIFTDFYHLPAVAPMLIRVVGLVEIAILAAFLLGIGKRFSYGLVLLFHSASTLAPVHQYLSAQLLFYAALPMWAACFALYLLRDRDTLLTWRPED